MIEELMKVESRSMDIRLLQDVNHSVRKLESSMCTNYSAEAEYFAEKFVAQELDTDHPLREGYKKQYIETFNEALEKCVI